AAALLKSRPELAEFSMRFEQRARTIRWLSLVVILATGFFNLLYEGGSARIESTYGAVLMLKLFLALVLFALTAVHDFVIGPPGLARPQGRAAGSTAASPAGRFWLGLAILGLSLLIVFIAVILVRL
ncbi:MAG: CopD family protein, partial [Nitrospirota bacterium]